MTPRLSQLHHGRANEEVTRTPAPEIEKAQVLGI